MKPKIIENYLSKETCNYIISYMEKNNFIKEKGKCLIYVNEESANNSLSMGWHPDIYYFLKDLKQQGLQDSLPYDLFNLIGENMCQAFDFKKSEITYETSHYKSFNPESVGLDFGSDIIGENGQAPHVDQYGEGGKIYTAILYLNDQYEGGELVFYEDNDLLKPQPHKIKAGSLVYFDGHTYHSVENITHGNRTCFILHVRHKETN
jgi:hypothetical protein